MNEAVIRVGFFRQAARRNLRITVANEQAFRRIEERLLGVLSRRRNADARTFVVSYGLISKMRLNGVSVARRKCVKPPSVTTLRSCASPACAPRAKPTSCESEAGVHSMVEAAKKIRPTGLRFSS